MKTNIRITAKDNTITRVIAWITVDQQKRGIYFGSSHKPPSHASYHESGVTHLKTNQPMPYIQNPNEEKIFRTELGIKEPLSQFRGVYPLFFGWASKTVLPNLELLKKPKPSYVVISVNIEEIHQSGIGFEAYLVEPNKVDLIHVIEEPAVECVIKDTIPWVLIRLWDGPPPNSEMNIPDRVKGLVMMFPNGTYECVVYPF